MLRDMPQPTISPDAAPPDVTPPISDPLAIRALAHPTRLALLEILAGEGQATATRCAELSGQSVASCSFHLRSLARHGFIEAVPGSGREKPWRLTALTQRLSGDRLDAEGRAAAEAFDEFFLGHEFARLRRWWAQRADAEQADRSWHEASLMTGATAWLTLAELVEVEAELMEIVERRFVSRIADRAGRPPDSRPVRLFLGSSVGLFLPDGQ